MALLALKPSDFPVTIASQQSHAVYKACLDITQLASRHVASWTTGLTPRAYKTGTINSREEISLQDLLRIDSRMKSTSQIRGMICNKEASTDIEHLSHTVEAALLAISEFGPQVIDLHNLSPTEVQGEHLATLLRATSTWKAEISGWEETLNIAAQALTESGIDPADALYGMI